MTRYLYNLIFYLALPFIVLKLKRRSRKNPDYALRWRERFGYYPGAAQDQKGILWFHAVSVGEVHAAVPLVRELMQTRPRSRIILTTMTPTGSARVRAIFGKDVEHVYMPYDFPGGIKRFLQHFKPAALVIMETELWPNLLFYSEQQRIPVMLANARLSNRSHCGCAWRSPS